MTTFIIDENGEREIDESESDTVICFECNCTNERYRTRCKNCGTKIKQTELTYEQEDLLIEMGMERERERKNVRKYWIGQA